MSTRIFVRGLPPTFTETEFRAHFMRRNNVTDVRLIPHRRIGYIGYKSPEDAEAAVRYFNKSFIRMSKIGVEFAKSVAETRNNPPGGYGLSQADQHKYYPAVETSTNTLKRKFDNIEEATKQMGPNEKLNEFFHVMAPKGNTWSNADHSGMISVTESQGDAEYTELVKQQVEQPLSNHILPRTDVLVDTVDPYEMQTATVQASKESRGPSSDADWLRSKTSRLLDLTDDMALRSSTSESVPSTVSPAVERPVVARAPGDIVNNALEQPLAENAVETISRSGRLFVRNLPYSASEEELHQHFSTYGELQEVHLPIDKKSRTNKGFVYVLYKSPSDAVSALGGLDGSEFQGRLLHIIPAAPKRENKLDDYAISKLPLKKQRELKRKAAATSQFSWNFMYMSVDAVISSVAHKLGVPKAHLLDPTSSDAAVKQAHAETHVIQETKAYLAQSGIDLNAFENPLKDDRIILLKNFPYGTRPDELRKLLSEFGELDQLLMPPTGTIAIAEFHDAPSARAAFAGLAYRRFKDSILFLEKGPKDLFSGQATATVSSIVRAGVDAKVSAPDLKGVSTVEHGTEDLTTIFVRNLSFMTTSEGFTAAFKPMDGFLWARVKTKTDPKKPGQTLSMGFGFVGFQKSEQASAALMAMDGYSLDGHKLSVKIANKGADAAAVTKVTDSKKHDAANRTKIIIKNLPFEVTKKDVRSLFGKYGTLRTVRMPTKIGHRTRGFAFAEFVTATEAANAMEALKHTHLLGRRLVLDYAQQDSNNAEEEIDRMTMKASRQASVVALAKLKGNSKSRVILDESGAVDDME